MNHRIKSEAIYRQKINDQEELKNSILQKAFDGELSRRDVALKTEMVGICPEK